MLNALLVCTAVWYLSFASSFGQGRQWQKALILLRDMEVVDGLPANLICYNAAADACGKVRFRFKSLSLNSKCCCSCKDSVVHEGSVRFTFQQEM